MLETAIDDGLLRRTASGPVRGRRDGDALAFLGIPYAAAPVGEARFAAPGPALPWTEVRDATVFGAPAPQTALPGLKVPPAEPPGNDWLTLNIWTPSANSDATLPVMVWLHGGAFLFGTASEPDYNGKILAAQSNVIVVTLNFRIGLEGFGQIEGAPANRGLLDVIQALKWIQLNIEEFGGDRTRVTVFGQSAGAGMAAALLAMPRAAGLFRRLIIQSLPAAFLTSELASDVATVLTRHIDRRPSVKDLAEVDPRELAASLTPSLKEMRRHADRWGWLAYGASPLGPVIDGETMPLSPWQALAQGNGRDIELLIGHTRDEFRLFMGLRGMLGSVTEEQAVDALQKFAPLPHGPEAYRAAFPEAGPEALFELVQSDATFRMPSMHLADAQVAGGGKAFFYELTWSSPTESGVLGACHALDYGLAFGITSAGFSAMLFKDRPDHEVQALSGFLQRSWTAFAGGGNPGWDAYEPEHRLAQLIDLAPRVVPYPEERSRQIWINQRPEPFHLLT